MKKTLPDSDTVVSVLQRIAEEKNWSPADTEQDFAVLAKHRLVYVRDLRALSGESWTQIELLPLVKDLLRSSIDPHWPPQDHISSTNNSNSLNETMPSDEEKTNGKKQKKKDGKKQKKDKKKQGKKDKGFKSPSPLGTPVVPTILTRPSSAIQELNDSTSRFNLNDSLSQDHITIQNTIRNGNTANSSSDMSSTDDGSDSDSDIDDDVDVPMSPLSEEKRKSVSFANEAAIGVAASVKNELGKEDKDGKKKDKKDKKKDKKQKKKNSMASTKYSGYQSFTSHPYTTHPIVKFRKMKMKHCKRLPPVPANDKFLQGIRDKLESTS